MIIMMALLSMAVQEGRPIQVGLPHGPTYRMTSELTCEGDGTYVWVVENRPFHSVLIASTLNGAPVEVKSGTETLPEAIGRLRDVAIHPLACRRGSGAAVNVSGVDMISTSATYGEPVTIDLQAEINCERRRAISAHDVGCRPEDGQ
jgi:hypothetical protein